MVQIKVNVYVIITLCSDLNGAKGEHDILTGGAELPLALLRPAVHRRRRDRLKLCTETVGNVLLGAEVHGVVALRALGLALGAVRLALSHEMGGISISHQRT